MGIQLYNTLSGQKEPFAPIDPGGKNINMYTCGVTVYDKCHIGHARSLYVFDVIRRYLEYRGYRVTFARNITDVDDKIINRALEQGVDWQKIVADNIADYRQDLQSLGIGEPDYEPRATENIAEMIRVIEGLIEKDAAYAVDGDVYFAVRRFDGYGRLSGQSIEHMLDSVRIEKGAKKRDPLDFALWKASKEGEPAWDSPWGAGRPGWHIECSCMSLKHLGCDTLDIHGGGLDLQFPHHENEIAQAEALTGKPFAKYWIHHGLLTINKQKMSKSLGNFITIEDAVRKYSVDDIKMLFLMTHYRSTLDFSDDRMAEVRQARKKIWRLSVLAEKLSADPDAPEEQRVTAFRNAFTAAMDDDFNTPRAWAVFFELLNDVNKAQGRKGGEVLITQGAAAAGDLLERVFGLSADFSDLDEEFQEAVKDPAVSELIRERQAARAEKNYQRSDEIRDHLAEKGIKVKDTPQGQELEPA
ncbi:MAG: cysteine--tRNA ligase [Candidatus Omnitrophota bacterium]